MTDPLDESTPAGLRRAGLWVGIALFVLILLLPTPEGMTPAGQRLLAVTVVMALFWVTSAWPMAVTSLLPLAAYPCLGILSAKSVAQAYFSDSSFLYFGGFLLAMAIEQTGLHQRFALGVAAVVGTSPRQIVLGFLISTATLSMWISNTATVLLMLPIAVALLTTLRQLAMEPEAASASQTFVAEGPLFSAAGTATLAPLALRSGTDPALSRLAMAVMLALAYAATIGGFTTLVGTPTNIALVDIWARQFPDAPPISAGPWMMAFVPMGVVYLVCTWLLLTWGLATPRGFEKFDRWYFRRQLGALGAMPPAQRVVLALFLVTALLWVFRVDFRIGEQVLVPGWGRLAEALLTTWGLPEAGRSEFINDSTVAMVVALALLALPLHPPTAETGAWRPILPPGTLARVPWEILLLFGGGFAIADAFRATHLSEWCGGALGQWGAGQPIWLVTLAVAALLIFLTEFTTNVATVNAVLPILAGVAVTLEVDPRLLMVPATVAASCGFMLPIGTPPNAIVFGTGHVRMHEMALYGLALNLLGVVLVTLTTLWLLVPIWSLSLSGLPDWAH